MDENVETIERKTDTILDAFSAVGGLMGFVTFFCTLVTSYFQDIMYKSHMIKRLYEYNSRVYGKLDKIRLVESCKIGMV